MVCAGSGAGGVLVDHACVECGIGTTWDQALYLSLGSVAFSWAGVGGSGGGVCICFSAVIVSSKVFLTFDGRCMKRAASAAEP